MNILKNKKIIFSCLTALLLINSCTNDINLLSISTDAKIDQSLVLPVAEAKLTINDIITKLGLPSGIDTLNNEISYLNTTNAEFLFKPFNIADSLKPFVKTLAPISSMVVFPAGVPIDIPAVDDALSLGLNHNVIKQRVDLAKMASSVLNVTINVSPDLASIPASDLKIEFIFPQDKLKFDSGITPSFTPKMYGQSGQLSLGSYSIFANGTTTIPLKIKASIKAQISPLTLGPASKIYVNMTFANIVLSEAWGLFNMEVEESNTIQLPFKIEDYLTPGSFIRLENPTIDISTTTNIGADLIFNIDYIKTYNQNNPAKTFSAWFNNHSSNSLALNINGPTIIGQSSTIQLPQFNKSNGEIDQLFDTKPYPNKIDYKYSILSNTSSLRAQNFITADSKVKFEIKTRINLSLKSGSNYIFTDTIKNVDTGFAKNLNAIDSAVMVLNISNGMPVKAIYRMTFWKSTNLNDTIAASIDKINDNTKMGTLFSQYTINAPAVNSDGTVKQDALSNQTLEIGLSKNTIEALKKTKFIVYTIALAGETSSAIGVQTTNPVHFTTKNSFAVKLGVFVKANSTLTLSKTKKSN